MANKVFLLLAVGSIISMFTAGAAQASPTIYPPCNPYGNELGAPEFSFDTLRDQAYVASGSSLHMLVCGAAPDPISPSNCENGVDTMPDSEHIYYAPGSRVTSTSSAVVPENSYAGSSDSSFVGVFVCDGFHTSDSQQKIRTIDPNNAEAQPECAINGDGEVTACYKIESASIFLSYMAVRRVLYEGQQRLRLEFNAPRTENGKYSLAELDLSFCSYFGQPQAQRCGQGGESVARNGAPSLPNCADGNGIFRARVHRPLNNEWSDDTTSCVSWLDFGNTDFRSAYRG